jgi:hypothetical protein
MADPVISSQAVPNLSIYVKSVVTTSLSLVDLLLTNLEKNLASSTLLRVTESAW